MVVKMLLQTSYTWWCIRKTASKVGSPRKPFRICAAYIFQQILDALFYHIPLLGFHLEQLILFIAEDVVTMYTLCIR